MSGCIYNSGYPRITTGPLTFSLFRIRHLILSMRAVKSLLPQHVQCTLFVKPFLKLPVLSIYLFNSCMTENILKISIVSKNNCFSLLLQMYGEKTEEAEELRLDLEDVKEMYKMQIVQLTGQPQPDM